MGRAVVLGFLKRALADRSGTSAVIFALTLPVVMLALGGGIDYSLATSLRQQAASSAEIACRNFSLKYAALAAKGQYLGYDDLAAAVNAQLAVDKVTGVSSNGSFINFVGVPTHVVKVSGNSPTFFSGILGYQTIAVYARRQCPQAIAAPPSSVGSVMFQESFETNHNVASNNWGVLSNWNGWTTQNAGIEINGIPQLSGNTIRFGNFFAELDSDCFGVAGCHSNSAMSREVQLVPGDYEIRYWYISRQRNAPAQYAGQVICGKESDVSSFTWDGQTNRIEVYVEKQGNYNFAASSMVDVCVYADQWVERRIPISIKTSATYRISWRAAGREDSYGGLIDYLRFCTKTCP